MRRPASAVKLIAGHVKSEECRGYGWMDWDLRGVGVGSCSDVPVRLMDEGWGIMVEYEICQIIYS